MNINFYLSLMLIISSVITLSISIFSYKRKKIAGALAFSGLMLAITIYSVGYAFEILNSDLDVIKFCVKFEFIGITLIPSFTILLALQYTKLDRYINKWVIVLTFLMSILTYTINITNDYHHFYYTNLAVNYSTPFPILQVTKGPWYIVNTIYVTVSVIVTNILFFRLYINTSKIIRKQIIFMFMGSIIPWITFAIYQIGISPYGIDLSPFGLSITGILFVFGMFKYRIFRIMPIAMETVFQSMNDGGIILDCDNNIMTFNNSAANIFVGLKNTLIGFPVYEVLKNYHEIIENLRTNNSTKGKIRINMSTKIKYYNYNISAITDSKYKSIGKIIVFNDITKQHELMDELNRIAITDELTQIYNRRYFFEFFQDEIERTNRYRRPLSLIIFDIDYFKRVNDTYGHYVGDNILKQIVELCMENNRASDIIARYGGEEFAILLPQTPSDIAFKVAERLRKIIQDTQFLFEDAQVSVTVSFGVYGLDSTTNESISDIIMKADKALYKAKDEGRNKVVLYS